MPQTVGAALETSALSAVVFGFARGPARPREGRAVDPLPGAGRSHVSAEPQVAFGPFGLHKRGFLFGFYTGQIASLLLALKLRQVARDARGVKLIPMAGEFH